ncbi:hypothetical protein [Legionella parisiensis]|uniref:Uncharacterized protein n=1 Tax=Legionella parisiensis TaxID=45071 RepID=A0A1E5JLT3_9GAMM|nr:hypothetical protein [Legionella parisiensis]KTD41312.1 hypothetical protein Lpar_2629 [Legionella parisiensis]OEH45472.1 hypothetical protein lpari_03523 [Legionella parisiensis]STX76387.1 Uncharacterised protein [Legionella parisiensis]
MNRYVLYLNGNGDGFICKVFEHGLLKHQILEIKQRTKALSLVTDFMGLSKTGEDFFLEFSFYKDFVLANEQVKHKVNSNDVPECIKQALSCKSRREVESYVKSFLLGSKLSSPKNQYLIENSNGTQTEIALYHSHFHEKEPGLNRHFSIKGAAHEETPKEMLQFVQNRSSFFLKNYKTGRNYQNTSWINPSWVVTCLNYYLETFKNSLAHTLIGSFVLGIEPTSFCEDFNAGCKSSIDLESNEINTSLAL